MSSQRFFTSNVLLFCIAGLGSVPAAFGQVCCEPDIQGRGGDRVCPSPPDGSVNIIDVLGAMECATGRLDQQNCPDVYARCDVNCDGSNDFIDVAAVEQAFRSIPNPCTDIVTGACCSDSPDVPGCVLATEGSGPAPLCSGIIGGTYLGDGTVCNPSPCDCNHNGNPDADDITAGTSDDCNANGLPDECELGACCFQVKTCEGGSNPGDLCSGDGTAACFNGGTCTGPEVQACATTKQAECEDVSVGGTYLGPCVNCPKQSAGLIREGDGSVFIHIIGPPVQCPNGGGLAAVPDECTGPPFIDPWQTASGGVVCHNFGSIDTSPIPADFFGPGSDPFEGIVCLEGAPLDNPDFGSADTLIERSADPFGRCDPPSAEESTVDIEIVELSLVGTAPITVTFNGGQDPEDWDVVVDLSPNGLLGGTPPSSLTAVKNDYNGGTYTSILYVQPRFTFTKVDAPKEQQIFDTFDAGVDAIELSQTTPVPWVTDVDLNFVSAVDLCSAFHAGIENTVLFPAGDEDFDGIPDICQVIDIPAASQWGLTAMVLLLVTMGTVLIQRGRKLGTTVE